MKKKLASELEARINGMVSVKQFYQQINESAISDLKQHNNRSGKSLLLYLSANMFARPKFPELTLRDLITSIFPCTKKERNRSSWIKAAKARLSKDLDISQYLRTVTKVKCMEECSLNDEQRVLLKYNRRRIIEVK